jgi:hypothetical protein
MDAQIMGKYEKKGCCQWAHCKHYACEDVTIEVNFKTRFCTNCRMRMVNDIDVEATRQRETKLAHTDEGPQFLYTGTAYIDGQYIYEYVNMGGKFGSTRSPDDEQTIQEIGLNWLYNLRHLELDHKGEKPYQKPMKQTTMDDYCK